MIPGTCDTATAWKIALAAKVGGFYSTKFLTRLLSILHVKKWDQL